MTIKSGLSIRRKQWAISRSLNPRPIETSHRHLLRPLVPAPIRSRVTPCEYARARHQPTKHLLAPQAGVQFQTVGLIAKTSSVSDLLQSPPRYRRFSPRSRFSWLDRRRTFSPGLFNGWRPWMGKHTTMTTLTLVIRGSFIDSRIESSTCLNWVLRYRHCSERIKHRSCLNPLRTVTNDRIRRFLLWYDITHWIEIIKM